MILLLNIGLLFLLCGLVVVSYRSYKRLKEDKDLLTIKQQALLAATMNMQARALGFFLEDNTGIVINNMEEATKILYPKVDLFILAKVPAGIVLIPSNMELPEFSIIDVRG